MRLPERLSTAMFSPRFNVVRMLGLACVAMVGSAQALTTEHWVEFTADPDGFSLVHSAQATPLWVASAEYPGVKRAVADLREDVGRVSGVRPDVATAEAPPSRRCVIIGTLGHSPLVDGLVKAGKLDVSRISGQWESFEIAVVPQPTPGVEQALVIAGSDKRGTIYGVYELSAQMGVSPWYWWADVPVEHRDTLCVSAGTHVVGPPAVKYRGIFLNDEAPDLTNWIRAKFGNAPTSANPPVPPGVANYGHEFYTRLFEVMLRLRANYLWPAMWSNAFNEDDPENARLADEYGIVMGTSHQEPMMRAQMEWDRRYLKTLGHWNYTTQADVLEQFWREGVRRNKNYENIVTMGLRGANDTPMAPGGPEANRALLEKIVDVQRKILREEVNPDVTRVPQLWCLYKEVQAFYAAGMRVPDDVTLLWADDNWGNLRRVPTAAERARAGGAGVYYHFDYHGGPRSYQWINANPIAKIQEQMAWAKRYGADRIWIVNVGHFKGYELPMEYFLDLAWAPDCWTAENVDAYTQEWAERQFGPAHAAEIADILEKYTKYNGRRKAELLAPDTYSVINYREAETVTGEYQAIVARAEKIMAELPAAQRDAFCELVYFPVKASANLQAMYFAAGRNALYAQQARASTNAMAAETRARFDADQALMAEFNHTLAGGKWDHFMDQPHIGYVTWHEPKKDNLGAVPLKELKVPEAAGLGVAVEGSAEAWPGDGSAAPVLPTFDAFARQKHYLEVFNRGRTPYEFTVTPSAPWIRVSAASGQTDQDRRIWVSLDWDKAPKGEASGMVVVRGAGAEVRVGVRAFNPVEPARESVRGFVESEGVISIEAEHFSANQSAGENRWRRLEDYGRTLSGMQAVGPVDAPAATPGRDAACLEYQVQVFTPGDVEVEAITAPTLNFLAGRDVRYAVSFDDEPPQTVVLVSHKTKVGEGIREWEKVVAANARYGRSKHHLAQPGPHVLKIWMIDPGVVMTKLVIDLGGLKPSYLGPPESFRGQ